MKRVFSLALVLLTLAACGKGAALPEASPSPATSSAVTRMVSEPVAADFITYLTDVCGGELYAIADGAALCRWDGALLEPLFDLAGLSEVKKIAAAEDGIWLECVREGESLPILELRSYDGELLTEIDLSGLEFVQTWGMLGDLEAGGGLVFADCIENIFVYTADGELKGSVETERNGAEGIVLTGAGLTVMQSGVDYTNCYDIDPGPWKRASPIVSGARCAISTPAAAYLTSSRSTGTRSASGQSSAAAAKWSPYSCSATSA